MIDPAILSSFRDARKITILTGAGISAESGIPTFRDKQTGLWENFEAAVLATPEAFQEDPALVWGWYEWRRMLVQKAEPNPAHRAIAAMQERVPELTLVTQNVDDLHERGGSRQVLHLHGELMRPCCEACRKSHAHAPGIVDLPPGGTRIEPPRCGTCGGRVRPGVVWFGEPLPELEWRAAVQASQQCDVFLCVGTSALVQPAASLTSLAMRVGAVTIQVNPNSTDLDGSVTYAIRAKAGEVLPRLVEEAWGGGK